MTFLWCQDAVSLSTILTLNHESSSVTMVRTARKPAANASYSGASETESEPEVTPRPRQKAGKLKRRVSQYNPQDDESQQFNNPGDSFRIPLKPINDELAEKRNLKRRKSRMSMGIGLEGGSFMADDEDAPEAPQDINGDAETQRTPKKTALARANQLKSVTAPAPIAAPIEILSSNFEEWMKMATDNVWVALVLVKPC
jgi:condensin complex subunit 2